MVCCLWECNGIAPRYYAILNPPRCGTVDLRKRANLSRPKNGSDGQRARTPFNDSHESRSRWLASLLLDSCIFTSRLLLEQTPPSWECLCSLTACWILSFLPVLLNTGSSLFDCLFMSLLTISPLSHGQKNLPLCLASFLSPYAHSWDQKVNSLGSTK